jgi:hypothetical protein
MKDNSKTNGKNNNKANGQGNNNTSGPMLKFNHVKREVLPQTRIDMRALELLRGYPLYVKELTDHEPPLGEVLEQCIINTLNADADFVEWLSRQPRPELTVEQGNNTTAGVREAAPTD